MKVNTSITLLSSASFFGVTLAWAPVPQGALRTVPATANRLSSSTKLFHSKLDNDGASSDRQTFDFPGSGLDIDKEMDLSKAILPMAAVSALTAVPFSAEAATTAPDPIPSALAAYAHYLSLFAIVGLITYERVTVEAGMSKEKEMNLAIADIGVGASGIAILISGYYRATQYGKGWDFYSHEPIFWLKMIFLCIFGAASLFPTATFIQRSVAIQTGKELEPMSEKLAARLQQVLNAELVMLASIPLAATFMVGFEIVFLVLKNQWRFFCFY